MDMVKGANICDCSGRGGAHRYWYFTNLTITSVLHELVAILKKKDQAPQIHRAIYMIPDFDSQAKAQSKKAWLQKISESASVYGWTEK